MAFVPMDLFPNRLLAAAIAQGVVDVGLAALLGAWLYREPSWRSTRPPIALERS